MSDDRSPAPVVLSWLAARRRLVNEGSVVVFRASERPTGDTAVQWKQTGEKRLDVAITQLGAVDPTDPDALQSSVAESPADSVADWQAAIEDHNGGLPETGYLYRVSATGPEAARRRVRIGRYVAEEMSEARCPECGNEEGNLHHHREGPIQPLPSGTRGECPECGHRESPIAFDHAYRWERLSEAEREAARKQAERNADRMAAYQESAQYFSEQREP